MSETRSVPRRPTLLVILDGFGVNPSRINNAVQQASTPRLDEYFSTNAHTTLDACGGAVGLPEGQMGNSEVGHMTLGSGTVLRQDLVRINDEVKDGQFYDNAALVAAVDDAKANGRPVHLLGLTSDGGVHSHVDHLVALIKMCGDKGAKPVVHMITDGRDTAPRCAANYLAPIEEALAAAGGCIATVTGRYWSMDRDKRWDRVKKGFDAMVNREGRAVDSAAAAIEQAYANDETDEFVEPSVVSGGDAIENGDNVIFYNFRNDRSRQMTMALGIEGFNEFELGDFEGARVTCLTEYSADFLLPVAYMAERPQAPLASIISHAGLKQMHCAETEKYAHVTFFFNGGKNKPYAGEDHVLVKSPEVATYDLKPEMSAPEVADKVIEGLESGEYAFILVNFANGDMVGHTDVPDAVIKAVEALDTHVGRVLDAAVANGFSVVLTADHGNCDEMVDPVTQEPHTQHTLYPVPCMIIDEKKWQLYPGGDLSNVAPTVLQLMGVQQPDVMTGTSLLMKEY